MLSPVTGSAHRFCIINLEVRLSDMLMLVKLYFASLLQIVPLDSLLSIFRKFIFAIAVLLDKFDVFIQNIYIIPQFILNSVLVNYGI